MDIPSAVHKEMAVLAGNDTHSRPAPATSKRPETGQ